MGRTINVKRNILYGVIQNFASHLFPFIVRTVLIFRFGVNYLGLNSLFASILNVLSLMELGFGTAIVFSMYKPVAEDDINQICAYLSYYRIIYRVIGLVILITGLTLMPFLNYLIKDPTLPGGLNLYVCYLIFLIDTVISYLLFGYMTAIPTAFQRIDILSRIDLGIAVFRCAVQTMILLSSSSFYLYLLSMPIITTIRNLFTAFVVRWKYPDLGCKGIINVTQKKDLKKKVSGIFFNKLTTASRNSIDCLCISAFIGLSVTGMYSNYYLIVLSILSVSIMICNSMMASVGNSIVVESREKNYTNMRLFDFIYMAIAGWATTCLFCMYQPFIFAWLGKSMMLDISVPLGLSVYFYILKSGDIRWVYHEGAGLWWECRYIMIGETIANIVLNIMLCKVIGISGVILATVLSVFVTNCILCPKVIFEEYFKNNKLREYWKDHLCYAGTVILSVVISWLPCEKAFPMQLIDRGLLSSIICLGGRLLVCSLLFLGVFWMIWNRSDEYRNSIKWLQKLKSA